MKRPINLKFFWEKVVIGPECWGWKAAIASNGRAMYQGVGASRVSWEIHNGEIPIGMFVLHTCDNPVCVNPKHLFLGTQKDNMQDKYKKGRENLPFGIRNSSAKVSERDAIAIRILYPALSQRKISNMYGINQSQVSRIVSGFSWRHL
jgi:hypothetical protein